MNRNNQNQNNQNFDNQNYNNQNYNNKNFENTQYSNQGYDQQYQNTQQQNFNNNPNYNVPPIYTEEPKEEKKNILSVVLTAIVTFIVLVGALYFRYNKFLKKENIVDLSRYEVNFVTYDAEGEGKPEADIKKILDITNSTAEISNFLSNPDVTFNKPRNLKNGDKVEVTITLNKNTVNKLKLKTTGEFKRTFTVNELNEKAKEKETIIVKEGSSNTSSSSSERSHSISGRTAYVKPAVGVNLRSDKNNTSRIITSIKGGASGTIRSLETNSDGEA